MDKVVERTEQQSGEGLNLSVNALRIELCILSYRRLDTGWVKGTVEDARTF